MTALVLSVTLYCVSFRFARGAGNFYRLYRKIPWPCLKGKSGGGQTLPPLRGAAGRICASACSRRQSGRRHPQCRWKDAPDRRRSWKHISPQCHVEVTPGRGVPDKISIVCLTGAAHYILSSNMPQVFLLRALPPVSCASAAKATGFVRYRWLLFFTESVCIRPRRGLQGGFSSTPSPNILRFLPYSYMM